MKKYYFSLLLFIPTLVVVLGQASAQDISKQNQKDSNQVSRMIGIAGNYLFLGQTHLSSSQKKPCL